MPYYFLPTILQKRLADYITANYSGSYNVYPAFSTANYSTPAITVNSGTFKEETPFTFNFTGDIVISVRTIISVDSDDVVALHDSTTAAMMELVGNPAALISFCNQAGNNLTVFGYYIKELQQGIEEQAEFRSDIILNFGATAKEF